MAMKWTKHPVMDDLIPSRREMLAMGPEKTLELWQKREDAIRRSEEDPYRYGFEIDETWGLADEQLRTHGEILIAGGNRAAKSSYCAKRVVQSLVENPGTVIFCFSETSQSSISTQQGLIWKNIPPELKTIGRTATGYISYSLKMGFAQSKFTLPNRSICLFKHYSQSVDTIEGAELGSPDPAKEGTFNIGYWCDELVPMSYIEALRYRCLTRSDEDTGLPARGLISFTAVTGWNNTVKNYLTGAKIVKETKAELLGGQSVPLVMQPIRKSASVVFFHTEKNPFGGYSAMKKQLEGADRETILTRAYGYPTRQAVTPFPLFSDSNIRDPKDIPILSDPESNPATWYTIIDPAGARPWSIIFIGVDAHGVAWVIDEFPNVEDYGPWVDFTKGDKGTAGDGQQPLGFGIADYAKVILEMERGRDSYRIIDPRMGAASYARSEGSSNIIDDLADEDVTVYPAEGLDLEQGIQAINNLLSWNKDLPMDRTNAPRLMFSSNCQNTISCMQEWRHDGDAKNPCKDFPDCVRYFAIGAHDYIDMDDMAVTATGGY
jgi:hypothetical protein